MPSWLIKASIQGLISILPFSRDINYVFQRNVSKGLRLTESYFEDKLNTCKQHLDHYRTIHQSENALPASVVELGTGWLPIVTIGLALCGIEEVITVDINPLLRPNLINETLGFFIRYHREGRLAAFLPIQQERADKLELAQRTLSEQGVTAALHELHIQSLLADARHLPYEPETIQFFVSNNTLEHIPPDVLLDILKEYRRVATPDAVMSHMIDLSDHYSHFDKRITPYHFLRFSPEIWWIFNNRIHYQNRLRVSDYRRIHQEAGFVIHIEENVTAPDEQIARIQVAPQFAHYSHDELIVTASWMVSVPQT